MSDTTTKPVLDEDRMLQMLPVLAQSFNNPIRIVELGCCDGYHTSIIVQILNALNRPWHYIAVEPDPRLMPPRMLPSLPPGVLGFPGAVGDHTGPALFHLSSGQSDDGMVYKGSSSLHPPGELIGTYWPKMRFDTTVSVELITLDDLCLRFGFDYIDFIWCDTQGCEGDIALGAPRMLPLTKWFFTEYSDGEIYKGQIVFKDLVKLLDSRGMSLHTDMGGDALFCQKGLETFAK